MGYRRVNTETPGVFRISPVGPQEVGTREAEKIKSTLCSVCFQWIGEREFIEVNGEPKHFKHVKGE